MALRALAADPTLGEAYQAVGLLRTEQGETRSAVRAFQEALTRAPLLSDSHAVLGVLLAETGHVDEGLRRLEVALRLDPHSWNAQMERARTRALIGDRAGADADLAAVGVPASYSLLVRLVIWWRDREGAGKLADAFERANTGAPWEVATPVLRAFARGEYYAGAPEIFALAWSRIQGAVRNRCRILAAAAEYFAAFGERERAFEWLERAEAAPFIDVLWMDRCPCLDSIRDDPRFAKVRAIVAARAADVWR